METVSQNTCFGGTQGVFTHASKACACDMTFGLFLPPEAQDGPVPVLWYLSGLTCTHENAMVKAGAQGWAAEQGIALVFPDTSPRGDDVANDDAFDLGQGAGFYVNATQKPWAPHFKMWDYIADELPAVLVDTGTSDQFMELLRPETLANAMAAKRQEGMVRMQKGYDHSYFFMSTFMEDHVAFHAEALHAG